MGGRAAAPAGRSAGWRNPTAELTIPSLDLLSILEPYLPLCRFSRSYCWDPVLCGGSDKQGYNVTDKKYPRIEHDRDKCALCEVCANHCPMGAYSREQEGDTLRLYHQADLCSGCPDEEKNCEDRCSEKAIRLVMSEKPLDGEADGSPRLLAESKLLKCEKCGSLFGTATKLDAVIRKGVENAEELRTNCPLCRRTHIVVEFIEEKRDVDGEAKYVTGKKWRWKPVEEGDPNGPPCPPGMPR